jgi:hypothetical protein
VNPGDWREDAKKNNVDDKEVIINGVCVMNQASDLRSDDGEDVNMDQSNEDGDENVAEGNDEDEIKKSFIKKPNVEITDSTDDVKVKKEVDEAGAWEY